uniref:Phospholipase A2-like central domain-containing protein n=1 Tax=Melopsittacus undulatus TaxID=13146 RepID=A0A8C6JFY1_MELUD
MCTHVEQSSDIDACVQHGVRPVYQHSFDSGAHVGVKVSCDSKGSATFAKTVRLDSQHHLSVLIRECLYFKAVSAAIRAACARPPGVPGAALMRDLTAFCRRRASRTQPAPPVSNPRLPYPTRSAGGTERFRARCGAQPGTRRQMPVSLFRGPERCCCEHNQCSAQITALLFSYGIRNYRLHIISHCECDCAPQVPDLNDTISNIIGVTFLNLLEVACFVLECEECVHWHWWKWCCSPLAEHLLQQPWACPALLPLQQGESVLGVEHECVEQLGCPKVSAHGGCVLRVPLTALLSSGLGRVCKSYKYVDTCEHQIVPSKVKYQLHNMETQHSSTHRCVSRRKRLFPRSQGTMRRYTGAGKVGYPTWPAAPDCCPAVLEWKGMDVCGSYTDAH